MMSQSVELNHCEIMKEFMDHESLLRGISWDGKAMKLKRHQYYFNVKKNNHKALNRELTISPQK